MSDVDEIGFEGSCAEASVSTMVGLKDSSGVMNTWLSLLLHSIVKLEK